MKDARIFAQPAYPGTDEGHKNQRAVAERAKTRQLVGSSQSSQEHKTENREACRPPPSHTSLPAKGVKRTRVSLLCLEAAAFLDGGCSLRKGGNARGSEGHCGVSGDFPHSRKRGRMFPLCVSCDSGSSVRTVWKKKKRKSREN